MEAFLIVLLFAIIVILAKCVRVVPQRHLLQRRLVPIGTPALRILKQLRNSIESLQNMPERGMPLDAVLSVRTDYRFLVCGNYRIFYLCEGNSVEVVRVLHDLQDYMRALFP